MILTPERKKVLINEYGTKITYIYIQIIIPTIIKIVVNRNI